MNRQLEHDIRALGGDPAHPVWQWFVLNGPHGPHFTWSQTRSEPAGYVGLEHLRRIVAEKQDADSTFLGDVADIVARALSSERPIFIRRAVQVTAAIYKRDEEARILALTAHPDARVASDARACHFVLRRGR
jgi:hypothetical protein